MVAMTQNNNSREPSESKLIMKKKQNEEKKPKRAINKSIVIKSIYTTWNMKQQRRNPLIKRRRKKKYAKYRIPSLLWMPARYRLDFLSIPRHAIRTGSGKRAMRSICCTANEIDTSIVTLRSHRKPSFCVTFVLFRWKCLNFATNMSFTNFVSRINSSGRRYVKMPTNGTLPRYLLNETIINNGNEQNLLRFYWKWENSPINIVQFVDEIAQVDRWSWEIA